MIAVMLPAFLLAMYEKDGLPAEKVARNIISALFIRPGKRPYKTENFYAILNKNEKEVQRIESNKTTTQKKRSKR
jgi:HEPN domain-containing protein